MLSAWAREMFGARGVTEQPGKNASVTLYHPDTKYLREEVFPRVKARCEEMGWAFRVSMTWFYINCDLEFISKGTGLDRLLKQVKIDRSRLAGIGDTPSDKCIAERVKFFACPANAQAAIKEHAHFIASKPETWGVVDILERLGA
jgi:hydroxymethylpyrimidine pyrophosphatase-like HAD family hydrolase